MKYETIFGIAIKSVVPSLSSPGLVKKKLKKKPVFACFNDATQIYNLTVNTRDALQRSPHVVTLRMRNTQANWDDSPFTGFFCYGVAPRSIYVGHESAGTLSVRWLVSQLGKLVS